MPLAPLAFRGPAAPQARRHAPAVMPGRQDTVSPRPGATPAQRLRTVILHHPSDGAPARPDTVMLSSTGRQIRLNPAAQTLLQAAAGGAHDDSDSDDGRGRWQAQAWTSTAEYLSEGWHTGTGRQAEAQCPSRPARLADGAEMTSNNEGLDLPLLAGAAPHQEPSVAGAKRVKFEDAEYAPSGAENAPAEFLGASPAQECAPRRSGHHRMPSRRFEEAAASAAAGSTASGLR